MIFSPAQVRAFPVEPFVAFCILKGMSLTCDFGISSRASINLNTRVHLFGDSREDPDAPWISDLLIFMRLFLVQTSVLHIFDIK